MLTSASLFASPYIDGKIAFSKKDFKSARSLFQKAIQAEPGNGNPYFYLGYMSDSQGDKEGAMVHYKRCVDLRTDADLKQKAYWKIVLYYKSIRDWDSLAVYSEKFLQYRDIPQVRKFRDMALQNRDPKQGEIGRLMRRASEEEEKGDDAAAARSYREVLNLDPARDDARWQLVLVLFKQDNYDDARYQLRELIQRRPTSWEYRYKVGVCEYKLGNFATARSDFQEARKLNENPGKSFQYFVNLIEGLSALEMGDYEESMKLLSDSLIQKESAEAYGGRARAKIKLNKLPEGDIQNALDLDKSQRDALWAKAYLAQTDLGPLKQFLSSVSDHNYKGKDYKELTYSAGRLAFSKKDYKTALLAFQYSGEPDPSWSALPYPSHEKLITPPQVWPTGLGVGPEYAFYVALSLLKNGDFDKSIEKFTRIAEAPESDYYIAKAHSQAGRVDQAKSYLERALQKKPTLEASAKADADLSPHIPGKAKGAEDVGNAQTQP